MGFSDVKLLFKQCPTLKKDVNGSNFEGYAQFFCRNKYLDLSQDVNFFSLTTRYRNNLPLGTQYLVEDETFFHY